MKRYTFIMIMAALLVATAGLPVAAQDATQWDPEICSGAEGIVFRTVNVTTSDLPASEECDGDDVNGWLLVEPWNRATSEMNPDRACFAGDWVTVVNITARMGWTEGSLWRVSNEGMNNPLVVNCLEVLTSADLGLNPGEGQVELRSLRATLARALELLAGNGHTMASYMSEFGDTPISELFSIVQLLTLGGSPVVGGAG